MLFDLLNEPHNPLDDDFLPLHLIGSDGNVVDSDRDFVGPEEWVPWANRLTAEVRRIRPNGLILVAGVDWAFDLRQIRVDAPGVVYSAHIYPNRRPLDWDKALDRWNDVPLFVGEWGGSQQDQAFGRQLAGVLRQRGIGWTAWIWIDEPHLLVPPPAPNYQATAFGDLVRNEMVT